MMQSIMSAHARHWKSYFAMARSGVINGLPEGFKIENNTQCRGMKPIDAKTYAKERNVTKMGQYFYESNDGDTL